MPDTVTITMTREHAQVVQDACEMLMRMKLGQTMYPTELMLGGIGNRKYSIDEFCLRRDIAENALKAFLCATGNREGQEKDMTEMLAYEVWGTIRHTIWKHDNPDETDSWNIASLPPLNESGKNMPKCKVE